MLLSTEGRDVGGGGGERVCVCEGYNEHKLESHKLGSHKPVNIYNHENLKFIILCF